MASHDHTSLYALVWAPFLYPPVISHQVGVSLTATEIVISALVP